MEQAYHEYYLTHLGIDRWVLREQLSATPIVSDKSGNFQKLFILSPAPLSSIEEHLFANMLQSIGIQDLNLDFIFIDQDAGNLDTVIPQNNGLFLVLGNNTASRAQAWTNRHSLTVSVIPHPAEIIQSPVKKAEVYASLCQFQKILACI